MPKRRDTRRFGPGPYVLGLRRLECPDVFPFTVPAVAQIEQVRLDQRVTLLAGDSGSGKSTILEAIAAAIGFTEQGGEGVIPGSGSQPVRSRRHLPAGRARGGAVGAGALALVAIVTRAADSGAQFVIATHSPILLATPAAQIYELDETGVASPRYDDLQAVRQMRGFLDAPERYLRQLQIESDEG